MAKNSRRTFLKQGIGLVVGGPLAWSACGGTGSSPAPGASPSPSPAPPGARVVALTRCRSYGAEAEAALRDSFDRLGGLGALVSGKTVSVKVNLTGRPFTWLFGLPPGETYLTHGDTALVLATLLFEAGARRVRFVESAPFAEPMATILDAAGWDVGALLALGRVELENTRNRGEGSAYAHLGVPGGGYVFSSFDLNHSYQDTDVLVSLSKMKEHATAGVTLSLKNLFGITPNSLYGNEVGGEDALGFRLGLHAHSQAPGFQFPGEKPGFEAAEPGFRVPRIIADLNGARPVDLAIVDGIRSIRGGEGSWNAGIAPVSPGVLVAGRNAVATDAVAVAVMGFADPRASRGVAPFESCDNHLLLAEQAGLGTADLGLIEVRGLSIAEARYPYRTS
jgi:uncharacterized protein (DUF362 family)